MQEPLSALQEMFPDHDAACLESALQQCNGVITDAAEKLLDKTREQSSWYASNTQQPSCSSQHSSTSSTQQPSCSSQHSSTSSTQQPSCSSQHSSTSSVLSPFDFEFDEDITTEELLLRVSEQVLMPGRFVDITVHRDRIWRTALGFYKGSMKNPNQLRRELRIEFEEEEGIDAGALRNEFYEILLRELNDKLFEGHCRRRLPKKDSNLQRLFETAGVILSHSILQGGPGFPCLCPAAFSYMLHLDKEHALGELPTVDDIPKNAATVGLLSLISDVSLECYLYRIL